MRRTLVGISILLGSAVGVFVALHESIGLKIVLGSIGAIAGSAIGGALAGIGRPHRRAMTHSDQTDSFAATQDEQIRNFWLDRGRLTASPGLPDPDDSDPHAHEP